MCAVGVSQLPILIFKLGSYFFEISYLKTWGGSFSISLKPCNVLRLVVNLKLPNGQWGRLRNLLLEGRGEGAPNLRSARGFRIEGSSQIKLPQASGGFSGKTSAARAIAPEVHRLREPRESRSIGRFGGDTCSEWRDTRSTNAQNIETMSNEYHPCSIYIYFRGCSNACRP